MKKVIQLPAIANKGRFANQLLHYVIGKGYAEVVGATVEIPKGWVGQSIFEINDPHIDQNSRMLTPRQLDEDFSGTVAIPAFFSLPHRIVDPFLIRETVQNILKWRPEWIKVKAKKESVVHLRRGDFLTDGHFPIISRQELLRATQRFDSEVISEDTPSNTGLFPKSLSFLEDFQTLMQAKNVFVYPRSTFSQMAALLGDGNIFMPYDYTAGHTTCKFRQVDPSKPVIFPTKNNSLP